MIFGEARMTASKFTRALEVNALLLIAFSGGTMVGFKFGYQIPESRIFFSWLGGVQGNFRRQGIAQKLLEAQEAHVLRLNLKRIYFTTYDRFPEMIALGQKNGYILEKSIRDGDELKYWFTKSL
jgi:predicted GNAT superfamily acetyltransferase